MPLELILSHFHMLDRRMVVPFREALTSCPLHYHSSTLSNPRSPFHDTNLANHIAIAALAWTLTASHHCAHHDISSPQLTRTTAHTTTPPPTTMDANQLLEHSRTLQKALEKNEPSSTIFSLLQPLEKCTPSEDALRSSKVGVVVAKCRSSKDPKVASLASTLINKWKAAVHKKKPGAASPLPQGGLAKPTANGVNGTGRSGTSSPAPPVVKKEPAARKYSVAPDKRNAKEDGVDTASTGDATRDGCTTLIYNGLCFMSEESPDAILAVSKTVEQAAYKEYGPDTGTNYKQKMRSLHLNLKMKQNTVLRRDVFNGSIDPKRFVTMTSDELKSEDKRKEDEKLEKENMNKAMTAVEEKAISTTYVSQPIAYSPPRRTLPRRERPHTPTLYLRHTQHITLHKLCVCRRRGCGMRSSLRSAKSCQAFTQLIMIRLHILISFTV